MHYRPQFTTGVAEHASGRTSRIARVSAPVYEIEIAFDLLRMATPYTELQSVLGFVAARFGQAEPFIFAAPPDIQAALGLGAAFTCRFADDQENFEKFMSQLWRMQSLKLQTVKGE